MPTVTSPRAFGNINVPVPNPIAGVDVFGGVIGIGIGIGMRPPALGGLDVGREDDFLWGRLLSW